ncbi:putative uncharacterized protein DDB_G0267716 [Camellia sinensis]|uniref:Uncharacterized protein n=1 Tax=Camellia sinensis var. sinensis TaxID=542762 RepID=A0A4S4DMC2_CAMSN|nr:putative uncharacterized protein DDB_G0267716 [Camellia sinensis]THG04130.1 hypothetical protein TEA_015471 [Camellia sinensis var. sinensis]
MDDNKDIHGDKQEETEEAEALSLSDFPITTTDDQSHSNDSISISKSKYEDRRSSSEPTDFFEFFNNLTSEMSHAEDIIFCGKLIPFKQQQQQQQQSLSNNQFQIHHNNNNNNTDHHHNLKNTFHRRRSESLSDLKSSQSPPPPIRNNRSFSLDYEKLRRDFSNNSEIHRNSSLRSSVRSDNSGQKVPKPRWYLLMFGLAKFPPEMELKDIKNRQVRRSPATLFPVCDGGKKFPVNRSHHRKSSWSLLRILSCKGHASVAVTASFGCMP